jgi:hypothetical protein
MKPCGVCLAPDCTDWITSPVRLTNWPTPTSDKGVSDAAALANQKIAIAVAIAFLIESQPFRTFLISISSLGCAGLVTGAAHNRADAAVACRDKPEQSKGSALYPLSAFPRPPR